MTAFSPRGRSLAAGLVLVALAGCSPSPDEAYSRGMAAFKAGKADAGTADLEKFVGQKCAGGGEEPRCRHAQVTLGHTYEKRGQLAKAWAAYDQALTFPPHKTDAALTADRDRVRDGFTAKQGEAGGQTPIIIRYRDEDTEGFTPRSVAISLDFAPVLNQDKNAAELRAPEFHKVYSGSVAAGDHVLVVDVAHGCAPSAGPRCTRSNLHRAWPFTSQARTPTTLEVRAYTEPEDGDKPPHPALDLTSR
ncbi:MAG TPA: hypothetical protein VN962_10200 [Polyangia bacterium]|nr:hypothetical protein [Polyangia bacterium]